MSAKKAPSVADQVAEQVQRDRDRLHAASAGRGLLFLMEHSHLFTGVKRFGDTTIQATDVVSGRLVSVTVQVMQKGAGG